MKVFFGSVGIVALFICLTIGLGALGLGGRWLNMKVEGWFRPREANIEREVFENTKSYNEGKEQELLKTYKEYVSTSDESIRAGLRSYVSHTFADYPVERLDPKLRNFVQECKGL